MKSSTESAVRELIERTQLREIYSVARKKINDSIATDIVEMGSSEMVDFATYWLENAGEIGSDSKMLQYVPGDIIFEKTVPITDMKIKSGHSECRITIFTDEMEDLHSILEQCEFDKDIKDCPLIGCMTMTIGNRKMPLYSPLLYHTDRHAVVSIEALALDTSGKPIAVVDQPVRELYTSVTGTMLNTWYGIEIALLHPVTQEIFANPTRELRDRKEQLIPVVVDGKPKRVKYVKKHTIKAGENDIYGVLEKAAEKLLEEKNNVHIDESGADVEPKRKFTRRKLLWRVIGHTRTLPSGKETWVAPYWKGILRNMPGNASFVANIRLVDKPKNK